MVNDIRSHSAMLQYTCIVKQIPRFIKYLNGQKLRFFVKVIVAQTDSISHHCSVTSSDPCELAATLFRHKNHVK